MTNMVIIITRKEVFSENWGMEEALENAAHKTSAPQVC